jgi:hypothetical protein
MSTATNSAKPGQGGNTHHQVSVSEVVASDVAQEIAAIEQIRDLLFGRAQRSFEKNLCALDDKMAESVAQLRRELGEQVAALDAKLSALAVDTERGHLNSMKEVGAAISELGAAVSRLGGAETD